MDKTVKFCVWHIGRCGSTVLSSMLNQHPSINCVGELLEKYSRGYKRLKYMPGSWTLGKLLIHSAILGNKADCFGFEMKVWHLFHMGVSVDEAVNFLQKANFEKHILLTRENYLRILVSSSVSKKSSVWHINSKSEQKIIKVEINPDGLMYAIKEFSEFFDSLKTLLNDNYLWLSYEKDIYHNPKIACNKVVDFLSLKPIEPEINLGITNPYPLNKIIINYEEISNLLQGTIYEWMVYN